MSGTKDTFPNAPPDMTQIVGGRFRMGSAGFYPDEARSAMSPSMASGSIDSL